MPRLRVSQRLRGRLKALLKRGDQTALATWSQERPGGNKISQQELSYFLRDTDGRRGITLDDLDDIAAFFRISIGELLGDPHPPHLTGDEQRMLWAFRALAPPTQEHFLALIETASLAPQKLLQHQPRPRIKEAQLSGVDGAAGVSAATASATGEDASAQLRALRELLHTIAIQLTTAAADPDADRPLTGAGTEETPPRRRAAEIRRQIP